MKPNETHPTLIGWSDNGERELHSVEEVTSFICQEGQEGDVEITLEDGSPFLDTFGIYLNRIADMDYRVELLKVLIPMQHEVEQRAFFGHDDPSPEISM